MTGPPAIYDVEIVHVRAEPVRHDVRHHTRMWFVDIDNRPDHGPLARFDDGDHVQMAGRTMRADLETFLANEGVEPPGGRITVLTAPRRLGYVFNPLTVYWCHDPAGAPVCTVAEVHNTYGGRHRYLLRPDDAGRAEAAKAFYVSPFHPVDGRYRLSVPEPDARLRLTITLHRPGARPFTASVRGVRRPATRAAAVADALRHPFETYRVRALITGHGLALWRAGLPIQPRPAAGPRTSGRER